MNVKVKIRRFNPEKDRKPYWAEYTLDAQPWDRVVDVLVSIKEDQDGTLTFRRSCAHGICGSDAMVINGRNCLACKVLVKDLGKRIVVEPIRGLPVIKDLTVDMEPFFRHYRSIKPFLINDEPPPYTERLQSIEARERFDDTTKCILCAACTTSCPSFWASDSYLGPAAIVQAHRFIFDDRDQRRAGAPGAAGRSRRRLALPHGLQLRGGLPTRDRHHARHRRGQEGDPTRRSKLNVTQAAGLTSLPRAAGLCHDNKRP